MNRGMLRLATLAALGLFAAASAQAFTYDNRTNQSPNGAANFKDPEAALANGGDSHFSMKFSSSGSNGNAASGLDNRFVGSSNSAFSSPFNSPNNFDLSMANRH